MEFSWTSDQKKLYDSTLETTKKLNRTVAERDAAQSFGREEWRTCGAYGLTGLCLPERYGGSGHDALTTALAFEAFGRGCEDMGLVFSTAAHLFACAMPVSEFGSERIKAALLPRLASGEWVGANAITETEAGSDVYSLKTEAERDGDYYVINGEKSYVTNGPVASVVVVYATTNPAHSHLGITAFAVECEREGISVGEQFSKMGMRTVPASLVRFKRCRVPADNRLGAEGQGARVFQKSMEWERSCLFAGYVGMMERQLEQTVQYARGRRQFNSPIGKNQAVSHRVADMKLRLEAARLLLYHACWLFDQGQDAALEISLAKLAVSEAAIQSGLDAIQIHGAVGYATATGLERNLRDAIPSTIFSGTSEIQRNVIARKLGV